MLKVSEIASALDSISPLQTQETWDNCGLNVGSLDAEVSGVGVALEATLEVVNEAEVDSLLIVHHPLLFKPLKCVDYGRYPSNILQLLVRKNITLLAWHTNFDKSHFSRLLVESVLGLKVDKMDSFVAYFTPNLTHDELVLKLKNCFELTHLACANPKEFYRSAALISGAGASMADSIDVDCLISGDMRYHDAMIARSLNRTIFDIRHFESERFFVPFMAEILQNLGIKARCFHVQQPFTFF